MTIQDPFKARRRGRAIAGTPAPARGALFTWASVSVAKAA